MKNNKFKIGDVVKLDDEHYNYIKSRTCFKLFSEGIVLNITSKHLYEEEDVNGYRYTYISTIVPGQDFLERVIRSG